MKVEEMMDARQEDLVRMARWMGAHIPRLRPGDSVGHWKYRLACSIARALKRGGRKVEEP